MIICTTQTFYRYSGLSTDEKPVDGIRDASTFWETDTGKEYEYRGEELGWVLKQNLVTVNSDDAVKVYQSGNYLYVCSAPPGTESSEAKWKIKRLDIVTMVLLWANGNAKYINPATNALIVAALPYS